jgi:elongation factor Ts
MATTTEQIKKLRELTGAGVLDAKRALDEHNGDYDKALAVLKEKSLKTAAKKAERVALQGIIQTYVHSDRLTEGRLGVMVEVNCETDFVARNDIFKQLARDIALQIAATNPKYVTPEEIPADVRAAQERIFSDAALAEGKSGPIVEKIVKGKLENWYKDVCLYRQPFIRDDGVTIYDLVQAAISKLRENIVVRRFVRYAIGE